MGMFDTVRVHKSLAPALAKQPVDNFTSFVKVDGDYFEMQTKSMDGADEGQPLLPKRRTP